MRGSCRASFFMCTKRPWPWEQTSNASSRHGDSALVESQCTKEIKVAGVAKFSDARPSGVAPKADDGSAAAQGMVWVTMINS